jgi:crotonobetainyl-CoA:carnitine CoA-transferase CaiB-like acyl-CoA transferase
MRLGEMRNEQAQAFGKPLDGVRVLAIEQLQSLPFATQLLARLGADVVRSRRRASATPAAGHCPP